MGYDVRFADLALPAPMRDGRRARALFHELVREGIDGRVEQLVAFIRDNGGPRFVAKPADLDQVDEWFRLDAPIEMVSTALRARGEAIELTGLARALTVDLILVVGEVIRQRFPEALWVLSKLTPSDDRRYLPALEMNGGGESVPYYCSLRVYIAMLAIARQRNGENVNWEPAPIDLALSEFTKSLEEAGMVAQRSPTPRIYPPIPAPSESTRERYRRALEGDQLGSFTEIWVLAPMPIDTARRLVDHYDECGGGPPSPSIIGFVSELYRNWPWIESDDEMPSPWDDELYESIDGDFVAISPAANAAGAEIFTDVLTIARRRGLLVYSTENDDFLV